MNNALLKSALPSYLTEPLAPAQSNTRLTKGRYKVSPLTVATLSLWQILGLISVSILLHVCLWYFFHSREALPVPTPAQIPEISVELSSAQPLPTPPEPQPVTSAPAEPILAPPIEDENALKPPPPKLVKLKPVAPAKPRGKPKPAKPVAPLKSPAAPAPAPAPAAAAPQASAASAPAPASTASAGSANVKETAAISGLASLGNPPPDYPPLALRRNWEGRVVLRIQVLSNGRAGSVEVSRSSGKPQLDQAAVEAVKNWKFIPAKRGDTAIDGFATQTIDFKLPQ
ncbi:energy transducer TonB [Pseudomonas sp. 5P_3.1_Bac2]|uniref:energy transducer TonB n=1 Tax=Pseudomonas sp. 5P_3.1_Bac2 TaxID=2971617 RepID=UPI0021CA9D27|nr:energy transducer TonB [Pseudomonas sp. 5P_3.1_Bac2]MCU1717168.1 energy transducer TonB [Pseudomonas sp. 5P_3.1_Bac2]